MWKKLEDPLLFTGCACIIYAAFLFNENLGWLITGLVLIGLWYLVGKANVAAK